MDQQQQELMNQIQEQQVMGQYMMYGFVLLILVLIIFIFFRSKKKKVFSMSQLDYFNTVMLRELNKYTNGETLKYYFPVQWRNSTNTSFHNYYLGLTQNKFILVKVKSFLGSFTDTKDNKIVVNNSFGQIKNLIIKEGTIRETQDKIIYTIDVKRVKFEVNNSKFDLKIKYKDGFKNDLHLDLVETFLKEKCTILKRN